VASRRLRATATQLCGQPLWDRATTASEFPPLPLLLMCAAAALAACQEPMTRPLDVSDDEGGDDVGTAAHAPPPALEGPGGGSPLRRRWRWPWLCPHSAVVA